MIGNLRDEQLALGLVAKLGLDGCSVSWDRLGSGGWEAWVACRWFDGRVFGRGGSRVSAISAAHVASIRRLGLIDGRV